MTQQVKTTQTSCREAILPTGAFFRVFGSRREEARVTDVTGPYFRVTASRLPVPEGRGILSSFPSLEEFCSDSTGDSARTVYQLTSSENPARHARLEYGSVDMTLSKLKPIHANWVLGALDSIVNNVDIARGWDRTEI
ncbi:hypothetical protein Bbelb_270620 [Branchiostoma belcheri]|nr:hypothetical protein Bbelb_270620 [Branchiostoma belcheri]